MTRQTPEEPIPQLLPGSQKRPFALASVVLTLMLLAFFWQPLLLGRAFYVFDLSMAYLPVQLENARLRAQGEFPLWNRHMYCGYPINAESEAGGLYPPALFFNLPVSPERAYAFYVAFHYALIFASTAFLARLIGLGMIGGCAAAMIMAFGGTYVAQTVNLPLATTFAWTPLILALQLRALQQRSYGNAVLAGICFGAQTLGAHPQMSFYTGLMILLLAALRPGTESRATGRWFSFRAGLLVLAIGLGLGAPQLLYNLELMSHSDRSQGVTYDFLTSYSLPPHYLGQLLIPHLFGAERNYVGTENFEELHPYWGLVTLGALAVGWSRTGRTGRFFRLVLIIAIILALGRFALTPILLQFVPGFNLFRAPVRWLFPATLAAALLAGGGFDLTLARSPNAARRALRGFRFYAALAVLLAVVGLAARSPGTRESADAEHLIFRAYSALTDWGLDHRADHIRTYEPPAFHNMLVAALHDLSNSALVAALLAAITAAWWRLARSPTHKLAAPALLLILGADLYLAGHNIHRFADADFYTRTNRPTRFFQDDPDLFRILPKARYVPRNPNPEGLTFNFGSLYRLDVLDGFPSVKLKRMERFVERGWTPAKIALANVKYFQVPHPMNGPGLIERLRDDNWFVYQNTRVLPRASIRHRYRVLSDDDALFAALDRPDFDPTDQVLLETEPRFHASSADQPPPPNDSVRITDYRAQSVRIRAELAKPGILTLSDLHYPGWRATVNGDPVPILRANGIFRGLALTGGYHDVVFTYRPKSFFAGLIVAAATILSLVVAAILTRNSRSGRTRATGHGSTRE